MSSLSFQVPENRQLISAIQCISSSSVPQMSWQSTVLKVFIIAKWSQKNLFPYIFVKEKDCSTNTTHTHTNSIMLPRPLNSSHLQGGKGSEDTDLCCTQVLHRALRNDNGGFIFIAVCNHNLFLEVKAQRADYRFRLCMNMQPSTPSQSCGA